MIDPPEPINRYALVSPACAALTVFSFCIGAAPIPGTGLVCFPVAIFFGLAALVSGAVALRQIRRTGGQGRGLALVGAWAGGLTILATLCVVVLTVSVLTALGTQLWGQVPH